MSPRTRPTFAKRQKELARQEKQRAKAERRQQRSAEKTSQPGEGNYEFGTNVIIDDFEDDTEPSSDPERTP